MARGSENINSCKDPDGALHTGRCIPTCPPHIAILVGVHPSVYDRCVLVEVPQAQEASTTGPVGDAQDCHQQ